MPTSSTSSSSTSASQTQSASKLEMNKLFNWSIDSVERDWKRDHVGLSSVCNKRKGQRAVQASINVASIPGRVFAFITVRRTTGPGTSCLRMRQSFVRF